MRDRLFGGLIAIASLAMLGTGSLLSPDEAGHGTHTQLGLPACGWAIALDRPCPTCGMTTAVARLADLEPIGAFRTQPMGLLIGVGACVAFWAGLHAGVSGVRLTPVTRLLGRASTWWIIGGLAGGAWAYKFATWAG